MLKRTTSLHWDTYFLYSKMVCIKSANIWKMDENWIWIEYESIRTTINRIDFVLNNKYIFEKKHCSSNILNEMIAMEVLTYLYVEEIWGEGSNNFDGNPTSFYKNLHVERNWLFKIIRMEGFADARHFKLVCVYSGVISKLFSSPIWIVLHFSNNIAIISLSRL